MQLMAATTWIMVFASELEMVPREPAGDGISLAGGIRVLVGIPDV